MPVKSMDINSAIKESQKRGQNSKKPFKNAKPKNQNRNLDELREINREISELKRKKSLEADPQKKQDIQDVIEKKKEKYEKLREEGRPKGN